MVLTIRRSKTDQEGAGRQIAVPYGKTDLCPVRALKRWLQLAAVEEGPLFRPVDRLGRIGKTRLSDRAVALVVKRAAEAAGLNPDVYAGHSLRAGFATTAAAAGASERSIMRQTGHRSERMVRKYIREGNLFRENAAGQLGL